jgi:branched-chain amino acid transport system ATP-binding protein
MAESTARTATARASGSDDEVALELAGATRRYGGIRAVDDLSMTVPRGERRAVIGPNGAGKTTLFKLISREEPVSSGRIVIFGRDVTRTPAHRLARLGVGRTYQVTRVFPALTVLENAVLAAQGTSPGKFGMFRSAMRKGGVTERARAAIQRVRLGDSEDARASELGHGQQRQLELALALVTEPKLLLLDEPAAGLSASERAMISQLITGLPDDITVLLIEHDMELALGLADVVTCLDNGHKVAEGTPDEIKADERVQAIYLGASKEE